MKLIWQIFYTRIEVGEENTRFVLEDHDSHEGHSKDTSASEHMSDASTDKSSKTQVS